VALLTLKRFLSEKKATESIKKVTDLKTRNQKDTKDRVDKNDKIKIIIKGSRRSCKKQKDW
jgi:hypothetical protein